MEKLVCSAAEFSQTIEEMINSGACIPLYVSGSSMNPFLIDGRDIIRLRKCTQADFRRRQILLFKRSDGSLVLHRVFKVLPDGTLLMNGDAQNWCERTDKNQVIAVAYETERNGKIRACNSPAVLLRNFVWRLLRPFRPWIMTLWRKLKRNSE